MIFKPKIKTFFWRFNPWQTLWLLIWNIGELTAWPIIVKNAPWIFGQMVGCKKEQSFGVEKSCSPNSKE